LEKVSAEATNLGTHYEVKGEIHRDGPELPITVQVCVDTPEGEKSQTVRVDAPSVPFTVSWKASPEEDVPAKSASPPRRITIDKYGSAAKANGGIFSVLSFYEELGQTLIVYGTADETPTNHEAAESLQQAIREHWANHTVPIKTDKGVTEDDL